MAGECELDTSPYKCGRGERGDHFETDNKLRLGHTAQAGKRKLAASAGLQPPPRTGLAGGERHLRIKRVPKPHVILADILAGGATPLAPAVPTITRVSATLKRFTREHDHTHTRGGG